MCFHRRFQRAQAVAEAKAEAETYSQHMDHLRKNRDRGSERSFPTMDYRSDPSEDVLLCQSVPTAHLARNLAEDDYYRQRMDQWEQRREDAILRERKMRIKEAIPQVPGQYPDMEVDKDDPLFRGPRSGEEHRRSRASVAPSRSSRALSRSSEAPSRSSRAPSRSNASSMTMCPKSTPHHLDLGMQSMMRQLPPVPNRTVRLVGPMGSMRVPAPWEKGARTKFTIELVGVDGEDDNTN